MSNAWWMHIFKTIENLSDILLNFLHRYEFMFFVVIFNTILQTFIAKFKNSILNNSLIFIQCIEKIKQLNDIFFSSEHIKNFKFSWNNIACFLSPFQRHFTLSFFIKCFKYIALKRIEKTKVYINLPKAPWPMTLKGSKLGGSS